MKWFCTNWFFVDLYAHIFFNIYEKDKELIYLLPEWGSCPTDLPGFGVGQAIPITCSYYID